MLTHVRHRSRQRPGRAETRRPIALAPAGGDAPLALALTDPCAQNVELVGAKAANLAVAASAGLPVLDGFVLTERLCDAIVAAGSAADLDPSERAALVAVWESIGGHGRQVVVRSSSRAEDTSRSSLAGQFTSVLGVVTFEQFVDAVDQVVRSAHVVSLVDATAHRAPMAVLVQPQLSAAAGGVMFGIDPVSGQVDHLVVAAVAGGPDRLVSGADAGTTHVMTRRGRLLSVDGRDLRLNSRQRRRLARLAAAVAETFGHPQDVEWAIDLTGGLWLLQSRPITAAAVPSPASRVLGPGPVAETFPAPLSPLEQDLWLAPLNRGLTEALVLTGVASRRRLDREPPVVVVDGWAAADLAVLGASPVPRSVLGRLNPVPPARRLRAAWRTGRLRAALPALAADVVARADAELASVRPPESLTTAQLVSLLDGSRQVLVSLHGYEVLIGLLAAGDTGDAQAAAGRALRALADGRAAGLADHEIIACDPVVLSLVPPSIGPHTRLPDTAAPAPDISDRGHGPIASADELARTGLAHLREELRLRARWLHELTAMVAWELGTRLHMSRILPAAGAVRWLTLDEVRAAVTGSVSLPDLNRRRHRTGAPLPAAFRLTRDGRPAPLELRQMRGNLGTGAGGGRAAGTIFGGTGVPPAGAVLVVRNLDPALATVLPHLGGLIAETGSVLSHLAILAREFGVPTVVGVRGAVERFPAGTEVVIDGTTGEVTVA